LENERWWNKKVDLGPTGRLALGCVCILVAVLFLVGTIMGTTAFEKFFTLFVGGIFASMAYVNLKKYSELKQAHAQ